MKLDAAKLILDIREAIRDIRKFTGEMTLEDYLADDIRSSWRSLHASS